MSEVWFPGAIQDPGAAAGYKLTYERADGHNAMRTVKVHFTVGTDSRALIRNKGLAQFLFPKVGPPIQFAEVDAYCSDSGTWNGDGPGLEFERLSYDEALTADQIAAGARVITWLHAEWGFPLTLWDGERVVATDCGFINHGSVLGRGSEHADHTDGVTRAEWDAMTVTEQAMTTAGRPDAMLIPYGDTYLQFSVDPAGVLIQSTYDKDLALVKGGQDATVLHGNRPNSPVDVLVLADQRILVGTSDTNGKNRAISYRPGLGWYDAHGNKLP